MSHIDETSAGHRKAWDLIPWVVNGRASEQERALVESHVRQCADCREELAFQRSFHASLARDDAAAPDPRPSLERFWRRVDRSDAKATASPSSIFGAKYAMRWLAAAVVVQGVGLAVLGANVFTQHDGAPYYTLTAPATPRATVRMVVSEDVTLSQLQALLDETHLQIVGGPTEAGVLSLAPSDPVGDDPQAVVAKLRAHPGVRFAEPLQVQQ